MTNLQSIRNPQSSIRNVAILVLAASIAAAQETQTERDAARDVLKKMSALEESPRFEPIVVVTYERVDPAIANRLGLVGQTIDTVVEVEWHGQPLYKVGVAKFAGQRSTDRGMNHTREARPAQ